MIVSCPSCESKYQVADDKVAGSMLRTRCKACGSSIVVDGTLPPAANNASAEPDTTRTAELAPTGASSAPAVSRSKPPPPQRTSTAAGAPVNSKPPPPQRRSSGPQTLASEKPGISKRPVVDVNGPDALDPNASSSDFYSKLLSKVSAPKTQSQPAPAGEGAFNPKKTYPPPREPFALANDRAASPVGTDAPHSGLSPQGEAAPGDFYSKILAKVRPQQSEPPATQAAHAAQPSLNKTLPPPSWGALPQAQPVEAATAGAGVAPAPIRAVQPPPGAPTPAPFNPKATAIGIGEFEVHVDIPVDLAAPEAAEKPAAAASAARLAPVPPKRSEPPLAANIQLPPINSATSESRPPTGIVIPGLASPASAPPPAADNNATAAAPASNAPPQNASASSRPDPTLEPSVKSMAASPAAPALDPYTSRPQPKRFAWMLVTIIGVGLLGVGGGVAATIYALKPSLNAAQAPVASAPVAAALTASVAPMQAQQPAAPPAQSQAAAPPEQQKPSDAPAEKETAPTEKAASKTAHNAPSGARAPAPAAAPAEAHKTTAKAEPAIPPALDPKSASKTSSKTALPPAPTPAGPSKGAGTGPFPKEVAQAMLGVAASQAPSCKKPGGPTGVGKAIVTFDTDGSVVITNVVGEGFAGTPTGQCVAGLFRRVRVPPFAGDRATATKVFNIPP